MPGLEQAPNRPPRKPKPTGLSVGEVYLGEKLDDLGDEVRALREKAPSPKMLLTAGIVLVGMFFASQVYMVSLIAESRGVDTSAAAGATKVVVGAGSDAAKAAVLEDAPLPPVPVEPAAAPEAPPVKDETPAAAPVTTEG